MLRNLYSDDNEMKGNSENSMPYRYKKPKKKRKKKQKRLQNKKRRKLEKKLMKKLKKKYCKKVKKLKQSLSTEIYMKIIKQLRNC